MSILFYSNFCDPYPVKSNISNKETAFGKFGGASFLGHRNARVKKSVSFFFLLIFQRIALPPENVHMLQTYSWICVEWVKKVKMVAVNPRSKSCLLFVLQAFSYGGSQPLSWLLCIHTHTPDAPWLGINATKSRILKRKWLIINTFAFLSAVSSTQKYLVTFTFKKLALHYMYTYLPLNSCNSTRWSVYCFVFDVA